jgi:hypothetical protein
VGGMGGAHVRATAPGRWEFDSAYIRNTYITSFKFNIQQLQLQRKKDQSQI